jgi:hypothetical protein
MNNATDFERSESTRPASSRSSGRSRSRTSGVGNVGGETTSQFNETIHKAGEQARKGAAALASEANDRIQTLLNDQVGAGADFAAQVADSVRAAADNLDEGAPRLAELVRGAADQVEMFSDMIRDQTPADILAAGTDFARRRPAVVFGAAAVAGYVLTRLLWRSGSNSRGSEEDYEDFGEADWSSESGATGAADREGGTGSSSDGD